MKNCVIIGSGLGGLSCGCILSKNGYDVTVLEQGTQIGGCLQCFQRDGVTFDTGMHYVGSAEQGQTLNVILRYLGIADKVKFSKLDSLGYDVISLRGEHYAYANGKEAFVETLAKKFPDRGRDIARYYDLVKMVASNSAIHSLNRKVDLSVNAEYQLRSVNEVIGHVTTDTMLKEILAGITPLYAGVENQTPFSTHALIMDFYNQSASRIIGGSSIVAKSLTDIIAKNDGKVLTRHKAVKIECDSAKATAVVTAEGERFPADLIVSAIHPSNTIAIIESHILRPAYMKRMARIKNTVSVFTVYLKFKKDTVRYMNSNLFVYMGNSVWNCEKYDELQWPKYILYMHFCHKDNPIFAESGEIITYMDYDDVRQWVGTTIGKRGDAYEEFKQAKAEQVISDLEKEIPGISKSIEKFYTSTPLTYKDYTDTPYGSMYGAAKDIRTIGSGNISCRTRIPNLLLAGQSITSHGMMGVLAGSLMTCAEVLTMDEIFNQIRNVN